MNLYETIAPGCSSLLQMNTHYISPTACAEWKKIKSSLLHIAVCIGSPFSLQIAKKLVIGKAIYVDIKDRCGHTPLFEAVSMGRLDIVELLISVGAGVNNVDGNLNTPLHKAANKGFIEIAKCLIKSGADVNAFSQDTNDPLECVDAKHLRGLVDCPLHQAVFNNHLDVVKLLHKSGANIDIRTNYGITPLQIASFEGHFSIVAFLLGAGANISLEDTCKQTPLHLASMNDCAKTVELLVQAGANVCSQDVDGATPLHLAARHGFLENVVILIKAGSEIWTKNELNQHPALVASLNNHIGVCVHLLKTEVGLRPLVDNHPTLMHLAVALNSLPVLSYLTHDCLGSLDARDSHGSTLLHLAALLGFTEIVDFLLHTGGNVLAKTDSNMLAACLAEQNGHYDVCVLLLREEVIQRGFRNCLTTPLHLAVKRHYRGAFECLMAEDNPEECNSFGSTPLHQSALSGNIISLLKLCKAKTNVNARNKMGKTALHNAAMKGHEDCFDCLLNNGAQLGIQDFAGRTALDLAVSRGHFNILNYVYLRIKYRLYVQNIIIRNGKFALYLAVTHSYLKSLSIYSENNTYTKRLFPTVQCLASTNNMPTSTQTIILMPLYSLVERKSKRMVTHLIKGKVNLNKSWDKHEWAALDRAIEKEHRTLVRQLVAYWEKKCGRHGSNALHDDASKENRHTAEELIKKGEWMYTQTGNRCTQLYWTARTDLATILLSVQMAQHDFDAPLPHTASDRAHFTIEGDRPNLIKCIKMDLNLNANCGSCSNSPLHLAAVAGQSDILKFLVAAKVNLIKKNNKGWTCVHNVAYAGIGNVVQNLVCCCNFTPLGACRENNVDASSVRTNAGGCTPRLVTPEPKRKCLERDNISPTIKKSLQNKVKISVSEGYKCILKTLVGDVSNINEPDKNGATALHRSAQKCNVKYTKYLLAKGADANATNKVGATPLFLALQHDVINVECVLCLVEATHDLSTSDVKGNTVLHWAVKKKLMGVVECLVTREPSLVYAKNENGQSPFYLAAIVGDVDILAYLKSSMGDEHEGDVAKEWTTLHVAVAGGHLAVVKWLLENCPKQKDEISTQELLTPLHLAVKQNHVDIVESLTCAGVDVDRQDSQGNTALHMAVLGRFFKVVHLLAKANARVDVKNTADETPLHLATAEKDGIALENMLEDRDATPITGINTRNQRGYTALGWAAMKGYLKHVNILVAAHADVDATNSAGQTPLHIAIVSRQLEVVHRLIQVGADVNKPEETDLNTPLHLTIKMFLPKRMNVAISVVNKLLKANAKADSMNKKGRTPLHMAIDGGYAQLFAKLVGAKPNLNRSYGENKETLLHSVIISTPSDEDETYEKSEQFLSMLNTLLERNIELNHINNIGDTPLHIAIKKGLVRASRRLIKAGSDIEILDRCYHSPLHLVALSSYYNIRNQLVPLLLKQGANPNTQCRSNHNTALHFAARLGHTEAVLPLVQAQENKEHRDSKGRTALHCAVIFRRTKTVAVLIEHGANPNAIDSFLSSPLYYAERYRCYEIKTMLLKVGAQRFGQQYNNTQHNNNIIII